MAVLTIIAIILGPILAVQVQKLVERLNQRRDEKIKVFMTLLTTKGRLVPEHVQALNAIYFFFRGKRKKDKAVVEAWDVYRDHLNNGPKEPQPDPDGIVPESEQQRSNAELTQWIDKGDEYLCTLLKEMAESLGYHFPDLLLKKGAYTPQGHAELEFHQRTILKGLSDVLLGMKSLPMHITEIPVNEKGQEALQAVLEGKRPLYVHVEDTGENLPEKASRGKPSKS